MYMPRVGGAQIEFVLADGVIWVGLQTWGLQQITARGHPQSVECQDGAHYPLQGSYVLRAWSQLW